MNGPAAPTNQTIATALEATIAAIHGLTDTPVLDAQVLLAHVSGKPRTWLLAHPEALLSLDESNCLIEKIAQLQDNVPLPYVLGEWEFYGLRFQVNPAVLIPRPETELMVETALEWLERNPGQRDVVDVGTGSGCVAISLAVHGPELHITAVDISADAAQTAEENSIVHQVDQRVKIQVGNLLEHIPGPVSLICANLPYIPTKTLRTLEVYGREPGIALDGGPEGLDLIGQLIKQAAGKLAAVGLMLLEIEAGQQAQVEKLAADAFPAARIETKPDLAGHPRLVEIEIR